MDGIQYLTSSDDALGANRTSDLGDEDEEEFNGLAERLRSRQGEYSHILTGGGGGLGNSSNGQQLCNFVDSDGMSSQGTQRSSTGTNTGTSATTTQTNSATNGSPSSGIGAEPVSQPSMPINCGKHHCLGSTSNGVNTSMHNYGHLSGFEKQTEYSDHHQNQTSGPGSSASSTPLASDISNQQQAGDTCDLHNHNGAAEYIAISGQASDEQQQLSTMKQMIQFSALKPATKKSAGLRHTKKSVS